VLKGVILKTLAGYMNGQVERCSSVSLTMAPSSASRTITRQLKKQDRDGF